MWMVVVIILGCRLYRLQKPKRLWMEQKKRDKCGAQKIWLGILIVIVIGRRLVGGVDKDSIM